MCKQITALLILGWTAGCAGSDAAPPVLDREIAESAIDSLTERLAQSISKRDAVGAAEGVIRDSSVVYVSDGMVIRGIDYVPTLEALFSRLDSLQFGWTRKEISFPTSSTAVVTGWASIRAKPTGGEWVDTPAIFTAVYRLNEQGEWQYVTSQKTTVQQ